jgi:hypothetical protein
LLHQSRIRGLESEVNERDDLLAAVTSGREELTTQVPAALLFGFKKNILKKIVSWICICVVLARQLNSLILHARVWPKPRVLWFAIKIVVFVN